MTAALAHIEHRLDQVGQRLMGWRAWAGALVALSVAVLAVSWAWMPVGDGHVALFGTWSLPACAVWVDTGLPCSQCGMTRSWVWAARGLWPTAIAYNPAGFALWVWLVAGGLVGAVRLVRDRAVARMGWPMLLFGALLWTLLLIGAQQLRLAGFLPLP